MSGRVFVNGLDKVIVNMRSIKPLQEPQFRAVMETARKEMEAAVKEKASLTDLTLKDLAAMGHPYAVVKVNPTYGFVAKEEGELPYGDEWVHIQSKNLYDNIKSEVIITETKATVTCGVSPDDVPYIADLIYGTTKMRERDFLGHTWLEIRERIRTIIMFALRESVGARNKTGRG